MNMPVDTLADPIAAHAKEMLAHLGEDPRRAGLRDTPQRFANALRFLTGGYEAEPRDVVGNGVFESEGEGVVLVRDIEFHSLCEHHLLPFFGRVHLAYLPGERSNPHALPRRPAGPILGDAPLAFHPGRRRAVGFELDLRPGPVKSSDVPRMALRRAVQICDGLHALGDALNVDRESLERWISGEEEVPMPVFIQAVGLLLEATATRGPKKRTPDSSDGGRNSRH